MFLKKLSLTNFRNYSSRSFEFLTSVTVLVGDNAQGKSNFLESIYFLSTTKSPKADADFELIQSGEEFLKIEGYLDSDISLEIVLQNSTEEGLRKKVKVNGVSRRVVDYIGNLSVVSFVPEDINLVTGSPSLRRWHIDLTLAQIDKSYKNALTQYGEVIIRKNRLLKMIKSGEARIDELSFWISQQLDFADTIQRKRRTFFEFLNSQERNFGGFNFEYQESFLNSDRLMEYQSREIASATSLIGPHRDDFKFKLGERDLAKFGSRGEHRVAVLDLKLTEASFIETVLGSRPILLLDDVFSELDSAHQDHVIELTNLQQTIIATVDLLPYLKKRLPQASFFVVENGRIEKIADK